MKIAPIIGCTVAIAACSLLFTSFTVRSFIDAWFLISLITFIIAAAMYIIEGGFFHGITYSFKRFFRKMTKQGQYATELYGDTDDVIDPISFTITKPLFLASTLQLVITIIVSYSLVI
jgi:hypothetical protein